VSQVFWQAKIWGILHDPVLKALHSNSGRGKNAPWRELEVMKDWVDNNIAPEPDKSRIKNSGNLTPKKGKIKSGGKAMKQIKLADLITSASDRGAIGSLPVSIDYAGKDNRDNGLELFHLLSGASLEFKLQHQHEQLLQAGHQAGGRVKFLTDQEDSLFSLLLQDDNGQQKKITEITDHKKLFWWLWRCLPIATCDLMSHDPTLLLMPAETRIPDASIWSHTSLTGAMAGVLTGFDLKIADLKKWPNKQKQSRAYLATFSFTPVQEVIKASRKMRDFWAGSWLLHYLSAKVSWRLALKYGPDSLIYPSLFQQPLIDDLLLKKWPDFATWIKKPSERQLLTAGFPNVIVILLPEAKVAAAMQFAKQALDEEWAEIGDLVFSELHSDKWDWMPTLEKNHVTWNGWLEHQWQTYWSAMPVGDQDQPLTSNSKNKTKWQQAQNQAFQLTPSHRLFTTIEDDFLREAANQRKTSRSQSNANVGSLWPYIFNLTRTNLAAVKTARIWQLPTAFDTRSTISGWGSIVQPYSPGYKATAQEISDLWQKKVGLFDGKEQLNATEVVKRVLHLVIPKLIPGLPDERIKAAYPDLTAGVAGYLKTYLSDHQLPQHLDNFQEACKAIKEELHGQNLKVQDLPKFCGIPWLEAQTSLAKKKYHPRHLSPGWLIEDIESVTDEVKLKNTLDSIVTKYYPGNNPADWYVLAFGDGDDMREWLKGGDKLQNYRNYVPDDLLAKARNSARAAQPQRLADTLDKFLDQKKRMGPSTHVALNRSLLDFSNQLVPYLTEQRYAGRLIYSGGDDVLAYTSLWEWDRWLWDIRECFRGKDDPHPDKPFESRGNYWRWKDPATLPHDYLSSRPLFTMGENATVSFGLVISSQSVPLAIALENMWEAEKEAKSHFCAVLEKNRKKDAVQVRILYANGNILKATAKFEAFAKWRCLLNQNKEAALFEQAAQVWSQHPAPCAEAIEPWVRAFSDRRDALKNEESQPEVFREDLSGWIQEMWKTTDEADRIKEIGYWLKLAAFVIRKRHIEIKGG
jgi:CRISPR-associated protein Cmr2